MERMYKVAKHRGIHGQSALAEALNQSPQNINNWEGRGASKGGMLTAARVFKCSAYWIETGEGICFLEGDSNVGFEINKTDDYTIDQFHDVSGGMGAGVMLRDQPGQITGWKVTTEWANKNLPSNSGMKNLCVVTGFGDSMRGMFNSGDPLIVDTGVKSVDFDAVYFFRIGNEGFIKTLQRIPGDGIRVISENKKYESWTITDKMDFEVFGRVLKVWRSEDF